MTIGILNPKFPNMMLGGGGGDLWFDIHVGTHTPPLHEWWGWDGLVTAVGNANPSTLRDNFTLAILYWGNGHPYSVVFGEYGGVLPYNTGEADVSGITMEFLGKTYAFEYDDLYAFGYYISFTEDDFLRFPKSGTVNATFNFPPSMGSPATASTTITIGTSGDGSQPPPIHGFYQGALGRFYPSIGSVSGPLSEAAVGAIWQYGVTGDIETLIFAMSGDLSGYVVDIGGNKSIDAGYDDVNNMTEFYFDMPPEFPIPTSGVVRVTFTEI